MLTVQENIKALKRQEQRTQANAGSAWKINASTPYETCTEQLSPFGEHLAMIQFFDLIDFKQTFNCTGSIV